MGVGQISPYRSALRATLALMLREVATSQGRGAGGYLWAVAEPVAAVALLSVIFALAFEAPPLGRDFALFYASGYLPFMLYSDLAQKLGVALRYSRPLYGYPVVACIDGLVARFLLAVLTHGVVIGLVLGALLAMSDSSARPDPVWLGAGFGLAAVLGLGLGALNACLFGLAPVWERIWAIVNRPLFILSGVLFLPEAVPGPYADWLWFNPLIHVVGLVRQGVYPGYQADVAPLYVLGLGLAALLVALVFLRARARDILAAG